MERKLAFIVFLSACWTTICCSFIPPYSPSLQPLRNIDLATIGEFILNSAESKVLGSIIPSDLNDAVAIVFSESVSGFAGGLAFAAIALIDGNPSFNESVIEVASSSGAFFATRGIVSTIGEIVGMSTPLLDILIIITPILVSELFKIRDQSIRAIQTRVGKGPKMFDLMKFQRPSMKLIMDFKGKEDMRESRESKKKSISPTEIQADISKWVTFSILTPDSSLVPLESAAAVGALSGLAAQLWREMDKSEIISLQKYAMDYVNRIFRASFEGSVQFLIYEFTRQIMMSSVQ